LKGITWLLILVNLFGVTACYKKVCPAYQSAFIPYGGAQDAYFAYFQADSSVRDTELLASNGQTWYGTAPIPYVFPLARPFVKDPYGVDEQFQKVISTKPFKSPTAADSTLEELGFNKVTLNEKDIFAVDTTLYSDTLSTSDSTEVLLDSTSSASDSLELFEEIDSAYYAYDQYYYELAFGEQLAAFESLEVNDSIIRFRDMPDSVPLTDSVTAIKRKWYQIFSPNYKIVRTKFPEIDSVFEDSLNLDYLAEDLFDAPDSVSDIEPIVEDKKDSKKGKGKKEEEEEEDDDW
jgi:hypothetical protein